MPKKISKNLVNRAKQLSQRTIEATRQREAREYYGEPEFAPEDVKNAGPLPTLYNVNTGEWEETTPSQAELLGAPIGPPNVDVLNKMWRSGHTNDPVYLYGSDLRRT